MCRHRHCFVCPQKDLPSYSHFAEKQKQKRSGFLPQAKEDCWHNSSWLFSGILSIRLYSLLGQGLSHIITHKIVESVTDLRDNLLQWNVTFSFLDHTQLWVSDESYRCSSNKNVHMHPQNLTLTFGGIMDLHPQTSWGPMNTEPRTPDLMNFKSSFYIWRDLSLRMLTSSWSLS